MTPSSSSFYAVQRGVSVIEFDELWGMHLVSWLPCVVTFRVPFPLYEILESSSPSMTSVVNDTLHFILLFSVYQVRWWSGEVGSVCCGFLIW